MANGENAARAAFVRSRLGSGLAILPLGVWTVVHVWHNLAAWSGGDAWQAAVTEYAHPWAQAATMLVVLGPLGVHTAWGVVRLVQSRPNNLHYRYYANLKYLLQRLSAIGVLLFLGAHLWLALFQPRLFEGRAEPFAELAHEMRFHTPTLVVYVLGTLAVAYHLANGLLTFAFGWGLVESRGALRRLDRFAIGFFLLLLAMSWGAIYAIWRAGGAT